MYEVGVLHVDFDDESSLLKGFNGYSFVVYTPATDETSGLVGERRGRLIRALHGP